MNTKRIELLEKFIEESPEDPFNYYAISMEYYEEIPAKSIKILTKLAENHPTYLPTYYKLAHLLWDDEKMEEAEEIFKKGITLAKEQSDNKTLQELKNAYQNFQFDW